jgi:hypothetical protein
MTKAPLLGAFFVDGFQNEVRKTVWDLRGKY